MMPAMDKTPHVVLCTCPDQTTAEKLAHVLVENRLAACVNILPKLTSVYRWEGKIKQANEYLLLIKNCAENYVKLETVIRDNHPYKVPEIIALSIKRGSLEYLEWITDSVTVDTN
jgi:periplasmic divalent cation tolerance protein